MIAVDQIGAVYILLVRDGAATTVVYDESTPFHIRKYSHQLAEATATDGTTNCVNGSGFAFLMN